jgi:hypothetical protein
VKLGTTCRTSSGLSLECSCGGGMGRKYLDRWTKSAPPSFLPNHLHQGEVVGDANRVGATELLEFPVLAGRVAIGLRSQRRTCKGWTRRCEFCCTNLRIVRTGDCAWSAIPAIAKLPTGVHSRSPPTGGSKPISSCSLHLRSTKSSPGSNTATCRHG